MNIRDFVNKEFNDFKPLSFEKLFDWHEMGLFKLPGTQFSTLESLKAYELNSGDEIIIAACSKSFSGEGITIKKLTEDVKKISGLSKNILGSIKDSLGESFSVKDLKENYKGISGLGKKTMANIIDWAEKQ